MLGYVRRAMNVLLDRDHFWREVVRHGMLAKKRSPRDWLLFRHTLTHECAVRRRPPGGLRQVAVEDLFPGLGDTPAAVGFSRRTVYNPSWDEIITIAAIVRCKQPRRLFELGTFDGRTTLHLAMNAPDGAVVFTMDRVSGDFDFGADNPFLEGTAVGQAFAGSQYQNKIVSITADTRKFDFSPYEGGIDFVFVDADHSYGGVLSDSQVAFRLVRPGGLVVWHDYLTIREVTRALIEVGKSKELLSLSGTSLVLWQASA